MSEEHNKNEENTPVEEVGNEKQGSDFDKRRKLLKASLASPLIATLPSGVAQAATSAFQCTGSTQEFSNRHLCWRNGNSCGSDDAVRKMVNVYFEPSDNGDCSTKPLNKDLIYDISDEQNGSKLSYKEGNGGIYTAKAYTELCVAGKAELLVMVDNSNGITEIKGVWPEYTTGQGYEPITTSCLTSIMTQEAILYPPS